MVDQGGAVAVQPVQGHQPVPTHRLGGGLAGEQLVRVLTGGLRLGQVVGRQALAQPPGEDVADGALAGLVAEGALDDAAFDHPADAGDLGQGGAVDDMTGGGPHDGEEPAVLDGPRGGRGDMGVDVAGGHGDARGQSGPGRGPVGEGADPGTERGERMLQAGAGEVREVGVQGSEVVLARVTAVLEDTLVAGGAGIAALGAGELPDDPVGGLDPALAGGVDGRVLLQDLERLGVLPLGGDLPAVAGDPLLPPGVGQRVDPVGLPLGGVVFPELGPGVRTGGPLGGLGERGAVDEHREDGAGGEVGGDADHLGGFDTGGGDGGRDGGAQHLAPAPGVLEGPVGRERAAGAGQLTVDDGVRVRVDRRPDLLAVTHANHHRSAGERAEVDADDIALRVLGVRGHGHSNILGSSWVGDDLSADC